VKLRTKMKEQYITTMILMIRDNNSYDKIT